MSGSELNIIVVGAGIAGLGAAIVLSRAGHNVTVSSSFFSILSNENEIADC
jgi:succinate dehydrogenase/fumarate reductase flavoprotein subunit